MDDVAEPDTFEPVVEPTAPDERLLNMIAELTQRVEKLEGEMKTAKSGLPNLPW